MGAMPNFDSMKQSQAGQFVQKNWPYMLGGLALLMVLKKRKKKKAVSTSPQFIKDLLALKK